MGTAAKYTQVKVSVDPGTASAFKEACAASDVSMAAVLAQSMADYSKYRAKPKAMPDYSTRRRRRAAIKGFIGHLELMKAQEEKVLDNTPENFQGSDAYSATEEALSSLEEAIDALAGFWMAP
jgi:hypothetical protein